MTCPRRPRCSESNSAGRRPLRRLRGICTSFANEVEECIAAGSNFRALPIDLPTGEERSAASLRDSSWEERIVAHLGASSELAELLAELPVRLRKVLVMRFVEERKQSDIAGEIGVSQVHVSRLIKQALVALRDLSDRDVVDS